MAFNCYTCLYRIYRIRARGSTNYCMSKHDWIGYIHQCESYREFEPHSEVVTVAFSKSVAQRNDGGGKESLRLINPAAIFKSFFNFDEEPFDKVTDMDVRSRNPYVMGLMVTAMIAAFIFIVYWFLI